jgi:carboxymethylenebutenolidase
MKSAAIVIVLAVAASAAPAVPKTVHFPSEDHKTTLVGYLFEPSTPGPHAAIVMLHGRAGPYSSAAKGVYTAATLSKRHKTWGEFWAERGYYALLVDSFGPRGHASGFPAGSYESRPPEVSEQTVRPLDAYGALKYLQGRRDIDPNRIGVQGWSNGGMTVLVTMSDHGAGRGFKAALAEYPGCGMDAVKGEYKPYAPLFMMVASADEEVSPKICQSFADRAKKRGADLQILVYDGAEHNFDDPGTKKQSNPANHHATEDAERQAEQFFAKYLGR